MNDFLTEQQTERFLEKQTRMLTMPDGKMVAVSGFMVMWNAFELLQEANMFTEERLIELAYSWSERENIPFEETLKNLIGFIHSEVKKI